ncbi:MAG: class II fructose-bisphosphate aldolase [Anaerostipes sp.]|jgi:fructose-bisphosphate aldolase class II|nr:class II fructose-bisphosphate aldolase [Anaerostipes sp.]MDD3746652.1 class II fructose-bisphosphate aldolase [Anaerostipes sp.]
MIIDMGTLLSKAKKEHYGVAAPNVWSFNTVRSAYEAARELKSPVILDVAALHKIEETVDAVRFFEKKFTDVTATLNLDHGGDYEEIVTALRLGFSSVMVDRSTLPFEENVREVSEIVKMAHALGVSVEAELGHVGQGYEYETTRDSGLTNKDEAVKYVEQTGVDCLAVSVGTSHGTYTGTPKLDFELLAELDKLVQIPLVLHGGSGTGDDNLAKAVQTGIQKVNLCTDLSVAGMEALKEYLGVDYESMAKNKELGEFGNPSANMWDGDIAAAKGYKGKLEHYMRLFQSVGKDK